MATVEKTVSSNVTSTRGQKITVREAVFEMLREREMTTIFGNPGSTELPMLAEFPDDFRYVLGLQEAVAVGIADGYAQASGRPTLVNLHTAPGLGNGMGAIFNAQANKTPLVVTAGQQARSLVTIQANLTNRDATRMPHPLVKWSYEPPRPDDVPLAIARATHLASLPPRGPVFVSIPMDDWNVEVDGDTVRHETGRVVSGRAAADPVAVRGVAARLAGASNPVLVVGPDVDAGAGRWAARLPREPSALSRNPAARDRTALGNACRPRLRAGRRFLDLSLLPEHPRSAPAGRRIDGRDHERSRRGGASADG